MTEHNTETQNSQRKSSGSSEHVDVLIIGAGISGIGAAHHLSEKCPDKSFMILESKASFGGTWRTHTYPGVRSDSELYTFGYKFKPWKDKPIAEAGLILDYLGEAIDEDNLNQHIRYQHKVVRTEWCSDKQRWSVTCQQTDSGEFTEISCNFLWMCHGYYDHDKAYTPDFKGIENYQGTVVHPQAWPKDLDYRNKRVVVIGSGATAATLVPSMAADCEHITMLQRSPTYFWSDENRNELADKLRDLKIPETWIHEIVRRDLLKGQQEIHELARNHPDLVKDELLKGVRQYLGEDYDIDKHFTPSYRPWQQRLAFIPDGELFKGIARGQASVVTDHIECFTKNGIMTKTGLELKADIIITATGFNLSAMDHIDCNVDGRKINFNDTCTYRGVMNSGLPNFSYMFGYLRTSWTMRVDLVSEFVCRLLNHMDKIGASSCTPSLGELEADMEKRPWIEANEFNPSYLKRAMNLMPQQGSHAPWTFSGDYFEERDSLPAVDLNEGALIYKSYTAKV